MTQRFLKLDKEVFAIFWPDLSILFNKVIEEQGYCRDSLELLYTKIKNDLLEVWSYKGELMAKDVEKEKKERVKNATARQN